MELRAAASGIGIAETLGRGDRGAGGVFFDEVSNGRIVKASRTGSDASTGSQAGEKVSHHHHQKPGRPAASGLKR
jgi:hypothetical protein